MSFDLKHSTRLNCSKGENNPLGATPGAGGVNFALYSNSAEEVYLLLFSHPGKDPTDIIKVDQCTDKIWHVFVYGISKGQLYGYKVKGPYKPGQGLCFNEHKLLADPYARALAYTKTLNGTLYNPGGLFYGYDPSGSSPAKMDTRDNTLTAPKSIVVDDAFDWQGTDHPSIPFEELVIYEVHVRGFTRHQSSGVRYPGTYPGFIEKIPYLKSLGVNALEFLPVHQYYTGEYLVKQGLNEYWGYNTICFFAPEMRYSTGEYPGCQVTEFKTMVRELHRAGIEVILDVVYNHTCEGDERGPTLCFRGIDNPTYYTLTGAPREPLGTYVNDTGCGNTINSENSQVLRLIMDSLRYWTDVMQVDGFRFDLAPLLARENGVYDKNSAFFKAIYQDPVLSRVKLIAEPWDMSTYQAGNFPRKWSEWNDKFRTTVKRFLRGDKGQIKDLAWRLTGSADMYEIHTKYPYNSINFITCHDGFTLNDLYSYNEKHNKENGENNRDGTDHNYSWNCGTEGETGDPGIEKLRKQMIKNSICLLFFSLGTPMVLGGDEIRRTQQGNNNPYCQDNEINWFNWERYHQHHDIFDFFKKAIEFRKRYSILYKKKFYQGIDEDKDSVPDILWFDQHLKTPGWNDPDQKFLCYQIDGSEVPSDLGDYHLFFILNGGTSATDVDIPAYKGKRWYRVVDTSFDYGDDFLDPGKEKLLENQQLYHSKANSIAVLFGKESNTP
ncbi:MAG: glycogen debranching protein GlgX [Spirochaetales bacterium]|nr:glycogen debranching protein GlgX [Spirochaetales bacterium]